MQARLDSILKRTGSLFKKITNIIHKKNKLYEVDLMIPGDETLSSRAGITAIKIFS